MKDNFLDWFARNRKTIGYTGGVSNVLVGCSNLLQGNYVLAVFWLAIGTLIIIDTREFK